MATNISGVYNPTQLIRYLYSVTGEFASDFKADARYNATASTTVLSYGKYDPIVEARENVTLDFLPGDVSINTPSYHKDAIEKIKTIYTDLGLESNAFRVAANPDVLSLTESRSRGLQPGDILVVESYSPLDNANDVVEYITMVIESNNGRLKTFPEINSTVEIRNLKYTTLYGLQNISALTAKKLAVLEGQFYEYQNNPLLSKEIEYTSPYNTDGLLQIGDIRFLVSPTQLSFSTQNGYEYFPTLRTQGNPKIPSMHETKQINVSLIFPNASSINNELLPLFAMFKRAPFVNIYNKDISNFFTELKDEENFVAVALSSINIQSVKGYPNTLQANITLLPFQKEAIGVSFKALKTFDDVKYKQIKADFDTDTISKALEQQDARLQGQDNFHNSELVRQNNGAYGLGFNTTSNFCLSEPFRAYYQGLLSYRSVVTDELGNTVRRTDNSSIDTKSFAPVKKENYIYEYVGEHNNKPFDITYNYISGNLREFTKQMNEKQAAARIQVTEGINSTRNMLDAIGENDNFKDMYTTSILTKESFYQSVTATFNTFDNFLTEAFALYGVTVESPQVTEIKSDFELLLSTASYSLKIGQVSADTIKSIFGAKFDNRYTLGIEQASQIPVTDRLTMYDVKAKKVVNVEGYIDVMLEKIKTSWDKLSDVKNENGVSERDAISGFWDFIFTDIASAGNEIDLNTLLVTNIKGIMSDSITIDYKNDVIDGWGVSFSNKLIPIQLNGFKYPFYQHIGSDDIEVSLSIISLQNGRDIGLKEQLSLLNDRLQNSTKLLIMNMPELLKTYDKNLKINNVKTGNIFSVFGIRQLVYNNSNVSSIQGKPNTWSITANFTQDNFTEKEYQSINQVSNEYGFEDDIINMLVRTTVEDGELVVNDLALDLAKIKGNAEAYMDQNSTASALLQAIAPSFNYNRSVLSEAINNPNLPPRIGGFEIDAPAVEKNEINNWFLSFNAIAKQIELLQKEGVDITDYRPIREPLYDLSNPSNPVSNRNRYDNYIDPNVEAPTMFSNSIAGMVTRVRNENETLKLRELLNNDQFRDTYKSLLYDLDSLYTQHATVMNQQFNKLGNTAKSALVLSFITSILKLDKLSSFISEAVSGSNVGGPIGNSIGIALLFGGVQNAVVDTYNESNRLVRSTFDNFKINFIRDNAQSINAILTQITSSYATNIARVVIRDPMILKKLFGSEVYDKVFASISEFGVNCYKDFDINLKNNSVLDGETLHFSPDFYLYNEDMTDINKEQFIRDNLKKKMTNAEIQANLIVKEYTEIVELLHKVQEEIFSPTDPVYLKIKDDLKLFTNVNNTPQLANGYMDLQGAFEDVQTAQLAIIRQYSGWKEEKDGLGNTTVEGSDGLDLDGLKFNMLQTARLKRLIELKTIEKSINDALSSDSQTPEIQEARSQSNVTFDQENRGALNGMTTDSMNKYKNYIDRYFKQFLSVTEIDNDKVSVRESLNDSFDTTTKEREAILEARDKAKENNEFAADTSLYDPNVSEGSISAFEINIYTRLHQLYILDSAIKDAVVNEKIVTNLSSLAGIPELEMLQWYGYREAEQDLLDTRMLQKLQDTDISSMSKSTNKLFPTQKIYFVEEDRKLFRNLDDYYSYDAIQSVDIVSNKYSAGRTAVLRLGNMYNSLTNKISLMAEHLDIESRSQLNNDDIFLGTLDIKPGTKIIIKQGYNANDKKLPVTFVGKIIELKPGPVTEIVAQSYGAQLNHYIEKLNFGFKSSKNEHGDIAITLLDQMLGSDGLGKLDPLNVERKGFSGRNLGAMRENSFNKFLISNVVGRINAGLLANDNPRDVNIFLPVNILSNIFDRMTFDWRVYQQTVWQALGELALYHNNTFPMVKLYNNDSLSNMDELRETVIVGDKSGYYKYTDSFGISSFDYKSIKEQLRLWNSTVSKDAVKVLTQMADQTHTSVLKSKTSVLQRLILILEPENPNYRTQGVNATNLYHTPETESLSKAFRNKYMSLLIIKKYFNRELGSSGATIQDLISNTLNEKLGGALDSDKIRGLQILLNVYTKATDLRSKNSKLVARWEHMKISNHGFKTNEYIYDKVLLDTVQGLLLLSTTKTQSNERGYAKGYNFDFLSEELELHEYLDLKPIITDNTPDELASNPQYKTIQKHHMFTDNSDIISNNIMVSQSFNNAVKLYYTEEPKFERPADLRKAKAIPMVVKAFGDTRDGDTRVLETYQKNIDPNYYEIAQTMKGVFENWNSTNGFETDDEDANAYNSLTFDKQNPSWNKLPAFYKVAVSLLQREVEKMYRGTLQVVGYPHIEPFDIIHLDDQMNNMLGTVEVEEVIQTFNPQQGFITTITPNLITYDRNPIRMAEINMINDILATGNNLRAARKRTAYGKSLAWGLASAASTVTAVGAAGTMGTVIGALGAVTGVYNSLSNLYTGIWGADVQFTNFLYDHFGNLFGRDCINFSALTYHNSPFMGGFGGVDYANINSIINHQSQDGTFLRRMASANDRQYQWIATGGDMSQMGLFTSYIISGANDKNGTFFTSQFMPAIMKGFFTTNSWSKNNNIRLNVGNRVENLAR